MCYYLEKMQRYRFMVTAVLSPLHTVWCVKTGWYKTLTNFCWMSCVALRCTVRWVTVVDVVSGFSMSGSVQCASMTVSTLYQCYRFTEFQLQNAKWILTVSDGVLSQIFTPSIDVCCQHLFDHSTTALVCLVCSQTHDAEILQWKTQWHQPFVQLLDECRPHLGTLILKHQTPSAMSLG